MLRLVPLRFIISAVRSLRRREAFPIRREAGVRDGFFWFFRFQEGFLDDKNVIPSAINTDTHSVFDGIQAARHTGALLEANSKLEKQVKELTRCLQQEKGLRAARDTSPLQEGALQEAKCKLEKQVEELNWRLHLEKGLRTNLEEYKAQEIAKLKNSLQEMKKEVDETNALLLLEREENARKAIEVAYPVSKEANVLVEDPEKFKKLRMEVESLKTSLKLEKQKAHHYERKYNEAKICCEERGKRLEDTEKKLRQLQESMTKFTSRKTL